MLAHATTTRPAVRIAGVYTPDNISVTEADVAVSAPESSARVDDAHSIRAMRQPPDIRSTCSSSATELDFAGALGSDEALHPVHKAGAHDTRGIAGRFRFDAAPACSSPALVPDADTARGYSLRRAQHASTGGSSCRSSATGLDFSPPSARCRGQAASSEAEVPCGSGVDSIISMAPHGPGTCGRHATDAHNPSDEFLKDVEVAVPSHRSTPSSPASSVSAALHSRGCGVEGATSACTFPEPPSQLRRFDGPADAALSPAAMAVEVESACSSSAHAVAFEATIAAAHVAESQPHFDGTSPSMCNPRRAHRAAGCEAATSGTGFLRPTHDDTPPEVVLDELLDGLMIDSSRGPGLLSNVVHQPLAGGASAGSRSGKTPSKDGCPSSHMIAFAAAQARAEEGYARSFTRLAPVAARPDLTRGGSVDDAESVRGRRRANDIALQASASGSVSASSSDVGTVELP